MSLKTFLLPLIIASFSSAFPCHGYEYSDSIDHYCNSIEEFDSNIQNEANENDYSFDDTDAINPEIKEYCHKRSEFNEFHKTKIKKIAEDLDAMTPTRIIEFCSNSEIENDAMDCAASYYTSQYIALTHDLPKTSKGRYSDFDIIFDEIDLSLKFERDEYYNSISYESKFSALDKFHSGLVASTMFLGSIFNGATLEELHGQAYTMLQNELVPENDDADIEELTDLNEESLPYEEPSFVPLETPVD